jgi:hypothetical protein
MTSTSGTVESGPMIDKLTGKIIPEVQAYLTRRRRGFLQFYLVCCPYCRGIHRHGAAARDDLRFSGCGRSYILRHAGAVPRWLRVVRDTLPPDMRVAIWRGDDGWGSRAGTHASAENAYDG